MPLNKETNIIRIWYDHVQKENKKILAKNIKMSISYLPTPPLGQDMTQGQFLGEV